MKPFVPLTAISLLARKLSLKEQHTGQARVDEKKGRESYMEGSVLGKAG